jgi:hypothetical protein
VSRAVRVPRSDRRKQLGRTAGRMTKRHVPARGQIARFAG